LLDRVFSTEFDLIIYLLTKGDITKRELVLTTIDIFDSFKFIPFCYKDYINNQIISQIIQGEHSELAQKRTEIESCMACLKIGQGFCFECNKSVLTEGK